ncbi:hypothetical protein C9J01_10275 [Photobacterium rosenbergii]|uniref:Uncharacterized protein n=1 Tax=Photobacterium rosenbergii TaxID=294936 RepID=A0A2T3NFB4_9GAMM|nr:hypothetical protein [Photobacterium rosenbergii]PSW13232.1 hypothetical protein C9J01_10275 [Photobacterium rosenbergii]
MKSLVSILIGIGIFIGVSLYAAHSTKEEAAKQVLANTMERVNKDGKCSADYIGYRVIKNIGPVDHIAIDYMLTCGTHSSTAELETYYAVNGDQWFSSKNYPKVKDFATQE